jgi:large subunit ribosomal protein L25
MMAENLTLNVEKRETNGTSNARRLRNTGKVPGSVSTPKGEAVSIQLDRHEFEMILAHHGRDNLLADIKIGSGKPKKAILREIQYGPARGEMLHADFVEISMTKKMHVGIPVHLVGDATGVTEEGGRLDHQLRELEVECLPTDLLDSIDVDVTALAVGGSIHIRDLTVDSKLTVLTPDDVVVASVHAPVAEEVVEDEDGEVEEAGADGAQPDVIGEKEEEGKAADDDGAGEGA